MKKIILIVTMGLLVLSYEKNDRTTTNEYDYTGKVVRIFTIDDYQTFNNLVMRDKILYHCKNEQ